MANETEARIETLWRYPVKGLTAEALEQATLAPGATLPFDRAYAIENGPVRFDPAAPQYLPKMHFLMLMRNEQLASLTARFDPDTHALRLSKNGSTVAEGRLDTDDGRAAIEDFLAHYMPPDMLRSRPRIVSAPGHSFSDVAAKCLHIVNLQSVRALGAISGMPVDPQRFRANVLIDGPPAWSELDWVGKVLTNGNGTKLKIFKRTERCAATNVNPKTGERDMKLPSLLSRTLGHTDFGVYARCVTGGKLQPGDRLRLD